MTNEEILKQSLVIDNPKKLNQSLDGVAWNEVKIEFDVTIKSNEELSNIINSLRLLRHGAPKNRKGWS